MTTLHELLAEADRIALARLEFEPLVAPLRVQADALKAQLATVEAEISTKLKGRHSLDEEFEAVGRKIENHGVDRDTLEQLVETRMQLLTGAGIVVVPTASAPAPSPTAAASPAPAAPEAGSQAQEEDKQHPARQRRTRPNPVVTADPSPQAPETAKADAAVAETTAPTANSQARAEEKVADAVTHHVAIDPEKISLNPDAFNGEPAPAAAEAASEAPASEGSDAIVDGEEVVSFPEAEPANDDAVAVLAARELEPITVPETLQADAPAAPESDPDMPAFLMSAEPVVAAPAPVAPVVPAPQDEFVPPFLAHS